MDFSTAMASWRIDERGWVLDLARLVDCYRQVEDHRHARGVRYPLWLLLTIATLAKLAGVNELHAIAAWAQCRKQELCRLFSFGRMSMPVATTWTRVFARAVAVEVLDRALGSLWTEAIADSPARGSICVAIDGKTLRGTIRAGTTGKHLLAVYVPETGVVLAQVEIASKANEISAAPRVLGGLSLQGMVVTGDAMFAQRALSLQVVEAGGDYLWTVKENQPGLKKAIEAVFDPPLKTPGWGVPPCDIAVAKSRLEKGHGRIESRTLSSSSILQGFLSWPHLAQVFRIETTSRDVITHQRTVMVRYGVTSLPRDCADAHRLLHLARQHWGLKALCTIAVMWSSQRIVVVHVWVRPLTSTPVSTTPS